jgi:retron-type reverse transcriptase
VVSFDNIDHELLMSALRRHADCRWIVLYVERWLQADVVLPDGSRQVRERGTPQGGVISPLLANLFLHYAFDKRRTSESLLIPSTPVCSATYVCCSPTPPSPGA